jgi:DNA-binding CsgD family transcriptional regulator
MNNLLVTVALIISLFPGMTAISLAYQVQKKYRLAYLSTYLYFQIFINVFGIYGISGQVMARKILEIHQSSFQTIKTIEHFFSFLGLPFFILAWYMFFRLCREISEKNISRAFSLAYFLTASAVFFAYGIIIILSNLSPFGDRQQTLFSNAILILYAIIEAVILAVGLVQLYRYATCVPDAKRRRAARVFAHLNLTVYLVSVVLSLLSRQNSFWVILYLLAFFSANLPPLLFWKNYLRKYAVAPSLQTTSPDIMKRFLQDYKISKREEEVIQELCAGRTNKEISQALFISLQTVKDHIYRIYQKTDVKNRVQLINLIQSYKGKEKGAGR